MEQSIQYPLRFPKPIPGDKRGLRHTKGCDDILINKFVNSLSRHPTHYLGRNDETNIRIYEPGSRFIAGPQFVNYRERIDSLSDIVRDLVIRHEPRPMGHQLLDSHPLFAVLGELRDVARNRISE